jgi:hypothetical protein
LYHRTNEQLIVPPAVEPISLQEAQQHLRIDSLDDADYVQSLITVARQTLEQWCWSSFIQQTWQYWWNRFWWKMFLPRPPVRVGFNPVVNPGDPMRPLQNTNCGGVSYVGYLLPQAISEAPSAYVTLPTTVWETSKENELPFLRMAYLQTFPVTRGYRDDVTAIVVSGYGPKPSDVPMPLRQAMKLLIAYLYANRGEVPALPPQAIDHLIGPYRFKEF